MIKVSAIVSIYKAEKFIRGCLEDLVSQTLFEKGELEIVLINSGSPENEELIIKEYSEKYDNIVYIKTEKREGIYTAWNRGIKAATGEYITNANADDRHRKDALETMANYLDEMPDVDLVYGDLFVTKTPNETFESFTKVGEIIREDFSVNIMLDGCHMGPQPMWRKSVHEKIGYFNDGYKSGGDYEFWLRMVFLNNSKMYHIKEFLGLYLFNVNGIELGNHELSVYETGMILDVYKKFLLKEKIEKTVDPVDIIFLTHGRLQYFFQTIDALIKRTRYPYRIILVDNDSDEEFKAYLKQSEILYDKIIYNQRNEWTSAFQKGIDVSESDPFVVSDPDILVPDLEGKCWLERLIDLHKQNPEVGLLALNLDPSNKPEKMPDVYLGEKIQYNEEIILSNVGTVMQAIKRKYFDFPYVTDWETCERIRRNGGKVGFAKNIVAYHLGWNEENDYPEYIVDKYKYFKENYDVDVYKLYTSDSNLLQKMEDAGSLSEYYSYDRPEVRKLVDKNAKRILDVGCSSGKLGGKLKEELGAEVWGIEIVEKVARKAREKLDEVLIGSVEEKISELPDKYFDTIIFADILEHLVNPDAVLKKIKRKLNNKGELIVSIPNVRHWTVIKALLDGSWQYEEAGILDKTHLRFFTFETALEMLKRAGFEAVKIEGTKLNDYEFPDSFIRKLREEGFNVDDLQEKSAHYQYIFKARQVASVSIVIPVYNQAEYLEQAVNSILVNTLEDIEIILVDNNSDDDTQVLLNKLEKNDKIKIIRNTENLGFPKAVNQGITASQGEFVLAANSDIVCTKDFLRKMIDRAEADDSIGIVGPVSNEVSGFQKLEKVNYETLEEMPAFAEKVSTENKGKTLEFPRVAFLCTLIKREVIEKIGGLDERFSPGNYEDDDFCLRAQLAGFKTVIALDVFVHHYGSKSFTADGEDKYRRLLEKNKKKFVEKWGASPDEIWLRNKSHKMPELFIPLENASDPSTLVKSANQKINENNYSGAYDDLKEAIGALENNSFSFNKADFKKHDLLNLAGKVALYLGKFDESKNLFTKELQIGKSNARAYESLGDLFEKTGDEETALKCYTVAFSLNDKKELKEKINKLEKKLV